MFPPQTTICPPQIPIFPGEIAVEINGARPPGGLHGAAPVVPQLQLLGAPQHGQAGDGGLPAMAGVARMRCFFTYYG